MIRLAVLLLLAGCTGGAQRPSGAPAVPETAVEDAATRLAHLQNQLRDDILSSYERDEPPEIESGMIAPRIGTARIGAGPGDVYLAGDLARAPSRWPLDVDRSIRTDVRSKRLDIHIAADETAAWTADEVSWRIEVCNRIAVIPLRITALYAHDGDRWVPVFEHLSFGQRPAPPTAVDGPLPKAIKTEVASGDLRDELSGILGRGLFRTPRDPQVAALDTSALVLGPGVEDEWRAAQVLQAQLPAGRLEERRVGFVGRDPAAATIAYWIGNYIADLPARGEVPAGKVRMRVTHVFEKRRPLAPGAARERSAPVVDSCAPDPDDNDKSADCRWQLVQSHMSRPISDDELTAVVFGKAARPKPLQMDCSDGFRAPAAAPRQAADPPATRTR
jgi:hypothetical protein